MQGRVAMRRSLIAIGFIVCLRVGAQDSASSFAYGSENITHEIRAVLTAVDGVAPRIVIATNHTGIDQQGNRTIDKLREKGYNITAILVPEHGLSGEVKAGDPVYDSIDAKTGLPIISIYKLSSDFKSESLDTLRPSDFDIIIFDMQDCGMRHYTYLAKMIDLINYVAKHDKKIVVFDRPNPIGRMVEGPLVSDGFESPISYARIPLRHAMTPAEVALYYNKFLARKQADLVVVPMLNYRRGQVIKSLPLPLSPNLRTIESVQNYSFLGILSMVAPFYVGLETPFAFGVLMTKDAISPSYEAWQELGQILKRHGIASHYGAVNRDGQSYRGLYIDNIYDVNNHSVIALIADVIHWAQAQGLKLDASFAFNHIPKIDKVFGNSVLRDFIDGKITRHDFFQRSFKELRTFYEQARNVFLYHPHPEIPAHAEAFIKADFKGIAA